MKYTPGQLKRKIKGFTDKAELEHRQKAYFTMLIMNSAGGLKEKVTLDMILGKDQESEKKKKDPLEEQKAIEALARRCGGR